MKKGNIELNDYERPSEAGVRLVLPGGLGDSTFSGAKLPLDTTAQLNVCEVSNKFGPKGSERKSIISPMTDAALLQIANKYQSKLKEASDSNPDSIPAHLKGTKWTAREDFTTLAEVKTAAKEAGVLISRNTESDKDGNITFRLLPTKDGNGKDLHQDAIGENLSKTLGPKAASIMPLKDFVGQAHVGDKDFLAIERTHEKNEVKVPKIVSVDNNLPFPINFATLDVPEGAARKNARPKGNDNLLFMDKLTGKLTNNKDPERSFKLVDPAPRGVPAVCGCGNSKKPSGAGGKMGGNKLMRPPGLGAMGPNPVAVCGGLPHFTNNGKNKTNNQPKEIWFPQGKPKNIPAGTNTTDLVNIPQRNAPGVGRQGAVTDCGTVVDGNGNVIGKANMVDSKGGPMNLQPTSGCNAAASNEGKQTLGVVGGDWPGGFDKGRAEAGADNAAARIAEQLPAFEEMSKPGGFNDAVAEDMSDVFANDFLDKNGFGEVAGEVDYTGMPGMLDDLKNMTQSELDALGEKIKEKVKKAVNEYAKENLMKPLPRGGGHAVGNGSDYTIINGIPMNLDASAGKDSKSPMLDEIPGDDGIQFDIPPTKALNDKIAAELMTIPQDVANNPIANFPSDYSSQDHWSHNVMKDYNDGAGKLTGAFSYTSPTKNEDGSVNPGYGVGVPPLKPIDSRAAELMATGEYTMETESRPNGKTERVIKNKNGQTVMDAPFGSVPADHNEVQSIMKAATDAPGGGMLVASSTPDGNGDSCGEGGKSPSSAEQAKDEEEKKILADNFLPNDMEPNDVIVTDKDSKATKRITGDGQILPDGAAFDLGMQASKSAIDEAKAKAAKDSLLGKKTKMVPSITPGGGIVGLAETGRSIVQSKIDAGECKSPFTASRG